MKLVEHNEYFVSIVDVSSYYAAYIHFHYQLCTKTGPI